MTKFTSILIIGTFTVFVCACIKQPTANKTQTQNNEFRMPEIPAMITDSIEIEMYTILHFWDNYNFNDTAQISQPEKCANIFGFYSGLLQNTPAKTGAASIRNMLNKAQVNSTVYKYFMVLCENSFYDPTSINRNDELYIAALEHIINTNCITETEKIRPRYQLQMAKKNRVGTVANNFEFQLIDGKSKNLHSIHANYTLVFFYTPGCNTCQEVRSLMTNSVILNELSKNNQLKIVAIYVDTNKEEWVNYQKNIPPTWSNGWDKLQQTKKGCKYDLKASPTLYLLDKNKTVLLKDAQIEFIIAYLSNK